MPEDDQQQQDDQQQDDQQDDQQQDDDGEGGEAEVEAIRADPAGAARREAKLRAEAADYRRKLREVEQERDELKRAGLDDTERAVAEAEARGRAAAEAEHARRTLEAEIRAAAAGKLQDPADAIRYLDVDDLLARDDAARELPKAITKLLDDKPYLAVANGDGAAGTRGVRRSSQGARTQPGGDRSTDVDGDAWLRKAAGRGTR